MNCSYCGRLTDQDPCPYCGRRDGDTRTEIPEHMDASLKAGMFRRGLAFIIDAFVVSIGIQILGLLDLFGPISLIVMAVWAVSYFSLIGKFTGLGRSLGKKVLGLEVLSTQEKPLSMGILLGRALIISLPIIVANQPSLVENVLSFMPYGLRIFFTGIGFVNLLMYLTFQHTLHDMILNTIVMQVKKTE